MKKNLLAGITALAVVMSSGLVAFAATDTTDQQIVKTRPAIMANLTDDQMEAVHQARAESMKEAVAELVASGTITQEVADKLSEIQIVRNTESGVDDLTEEQREALDEAMKSAVAKLVEDGTLTKDEADQLAIRPMKIKVAQRFEISGLTDEQRTVLHDTMKAKLESKLSDLVDDGTLAQELADQLLNDSGVLRMGPGGRHANDFCGRTGNPVSGESSAETIDTTL